MAEDPNTWGPVERVVDQVLTDHFNELDAEICGHSLPRRIADALRAAGLIVPEGA